MLKRLWRKFGPNPLDRILKKAAFEKKKHILVAWNRGLGDIPLGLYALVYRIRQCVPNATVTFLTRKDLLDGFKMLEGVTAFAVPSWKRGNPFDIKQSMQEAGLDQKNFDLILERPDPTQWLRWQLGILTPKLKWNHEWDELWKRFGLGEDTTYIGVHVQTETNYGYEKNWPIVQWQELFAKLKSQGRIVLFGSAPNSEFTQEGIIDLRGKTSLLEMLSIIKNRLSFLVVPDSGVLSMTYFLDTAFPIKIVSLWADPRQGVLKQNVASPNPMLKHLALIGNNEDVRLITVGEVWDALFSEELCTKNNS